MNLQELIAKRKAEAQAKAEAVILPNAQKPTLNSIINQINTKVYENNESQPDAQKIAFVGISENKIINKKHDFVTIPKNPASTKASLLEIIKQKKQALSTEQLVEEAKATQEAIKKEMNIHTVEEAKAFISTPTAREQGNLPAKIALSLKEKLQQKLQQAKATTETVSTVSTSTVNTRRETFALDIVLNERQQAAVDMADAGKSFVLLGAAGTGKTSSEGAILHRLLEHDRMSMTSYKISGTTRIDAPSVAVVAYTRRAAANSAKAILKDPLLSEKLSHNIMTIHALLEYIPETYYDAVDNKEKFRFAPTRNASNPLRITHLIIEEATLVGLDVWEALYEALPYDVQIIFVGDINQLPPVFGPSILNYALTKLPVIELQEVYRQAEGSPIINNAHRILRGEMLKEGVNEQGRLTIISGKNDVKVGQEKTFAAFNTIFKSFYDQGLYNPDEDMILSPWNKHLLGTDSLNNMIAEFLSIKHDTLVYEVIAGYNKRYLAEGDKVIVNKRDAIIVGIDRNPAYVGKEPKIPSTRLSRFGHMRMTGNDVAILDEEDDLDSIDYSNFSIEDIENTSMERKMQASHRITIAYDTGYTETLSNAGDLAPNVFSLGYAMTVHKSQGSEWRRVFIIMHTDHAISLNREMLYTAITRAREEVYILAKRYTLDKAVISQKVKGNTLEDKIAIFNSGLVEANSKEVPVLKPSLSNR